MCRASLAPSLRADVAVLFVKQYELKRQVVRVDAKASKGDVEAPAPVAIARVAAAPIAPVASRSSSHTTEKTAV